MVEIKKMRQLVRAVQSLSSQSKVGTSPPQASSAKSQRTGRGSNHCLNPVVGKQECNEARARRAMKLLKHMGCFLTLRMKWQPFPATFCYVIDYEHQFDVICITEQLYVVLTQG